jgi:hypothetical protein
MFGRALTGCASCICMGCWTMTCSHWPRIWSSHRAVFEPRMLRVPEDHLAALWFRDKLGSSEEVVPITPAPSEFVAFRRYTAADFPQTAALLARRNVDLYSSAEGEVGELGR